MNKLEKITADYFHTIAKRQNTNAEWNYLSLDRKAEWQEEMHERLLFCLEFIKKELELDKAVSYPQASYERGFVAGESYENTRLTGKVHLLVSTLDNELMEFIDKCMDQK